MHIMSATILTRWLGQEILPPPPSAIINLRGDYTIFPETFIFFCTCHNFFPLSSVQIIIIPACCLLCVL